MEQQIQRIPFSKWKPVEVMLAILFLVAPLYYHINIGGEGLRIPFNISVWLVAFLVICWSCFLVLKREAIMLPRGLIFLFTFPILILASGFLSKVLEPMEWLFRLLYIWCGLFFLISLFQHNLKQGRVDRILFIVLISALSQALIGYFQLNHPELIPSIFPVSRLVPFGVFQQINNQATYQVTALVIGLFLITRPFIARGHLLAKALVAMSLFFSSYIIAVSGSRAGVISFIIAILIISFARYKYFSKHKTLSIIAFSFVITGGFIGSAGLNAFYDKTVALNSGLSGSARIGIYSVAVEAVKKEPLFGYGIGSFPSVWQYEKGSYQEKNPNADLIQLYVTHPHNEILFWLLEGGLMSVIGMFILAGGVIKKLLTIPASHRYSYLSFVTPISIHTQVELPFYTSAIHWFLLILMLFLIFRLRPTKKLLFISTPMMSVLRVTFLVVFMSGVLFFANSLKAIREIGNVDKSYNLWNMPYAVVNPYFNGLIESMKMKSSLIMLYDSEFDVDENGKFKINAESDQGFKNFISWAEQYALREPSAQTFLYLIMAYQKTNQTRKMCNTAKTAHNIYNKNINFKNIIGICKDDK